MNLTNFGGNTVIRIGDNATHDVIIINEQGSTMRRLRGEGPAEYSLKGKLPAGFYMARANIDGKMSGLMPFFIDAGN